jgi:cell division protein FtsL
MRDIGDRLSDSKRKKRRRTLLILLCTSLLFSVFLLHIWFSSKAVELAYEIDRLAAEKEALEEENKRLSLETARLKSPERISRIATTDLDMIRSSDAEVIMLER